MTDGIAIRESVKALKEETFGSDLTMKDVAYVLDLDITTVGRYLREGAIVGYKIGKEWRIPADSLRAYRNHLLNGHAP